MQQYVQADLARSKTNDRKSVLRSATKVQPKPGTFYNKGLEDKFAKILGMRDYESDTVFFYED